MPEETTTQPLKTVDVAPLQINNKDIVHSAPPITELPVAPEYTLGDLPKDAIKVNTNLQIEVGGQLDAAVWDMATKESDKPERRTWDMNASDLGLDQNKWLGVHIESVNRPAIEVKTDKNTHISYSDVNLSVQINAGPQAPNSLDIVDRNFVRIAKQIQSANPNLAVNPSYDAQQGFSGMTVTDRDNGTVYIIQADANGSIQAETALTDKDSADTIRDQVKTFFSTINSLTPMIEQTADEENRGPEITPEQQLLIKKIESGERILNAPERETLLQKVKEAEAKIEELTQKAKELNQRYDEERQQIEDQLTQENLTAAKEQIDHFRKTGEIISGTGNAAVREELGNRMITMGQSLAENEATTFEQTQTLKNTVITEGITVDTYLQLFKTDTPLVDQVENFKQQLEDSKKPPEIKKEDNTTSLRQAINST